MNIHTNPVLPEAPTDPAAEVFATRGEARGTGGFFRIESRSDGARSLHTEGDGALHFAPAALNWWSADWIMEPAADGDIHIRNRWLNTFVTIKDGNVAMSPTSDGYATRWRVYLPGDKDAKVLWNRQTGQVLAESGGKLSLANYSLTQPSSQWIVRRRIHSWPRGTSVQDGKAIRFEPRILDREVELGDGQTAAAHLVITPVIARTDHGGAYLYISLNGTTVDASKTGKMWQDSRLARGWYIESVETAINVRGRGIQLLERGDQVPNATGSVTSTVSQSRSLGLSADLGSLGMTNSKGWSFSRTLDGFKVRASGGGTIAGGDGAYASASLAMASSKEGGNGGLIPYDTWRDLVDSPQDGAGQFWSGFSGFFTGDAFQSYHMHGLVDQAKSGLPVLSHASFLIREKAEQRMIIVEPTLTLKLRRVYSSGETKFDSTYGAASKTVTISQAMEIDLSLRTYGPGV